MERNRNTCRLFWTSSVLTFVALPLLRIHHLSTVSSLQLIYCDRTELSALNLPCHVPGTASDALRAAAWGAPCARPCCPRDPRPHAHGDCPDDTSSFCSVGGRSRVSIQEAVTPLVGGWFSAADHAGMSRLVRPSPHVLCASLASRLCLQTQFILGNS